jgi:hypothetical protein
MPEKEDVTKILNQHSDKLFVQRILNPDDYPRLDNEDGTVSSHSMAWGTNGDGKHFVYPTVVMNRSGVLQRLSDDDAWDNSRKTGNYIEMPSEEKADWFSKKYKVVWE